LVLQYVGLQHQSVLIQDFRDAKNKEQLINQCKEAIHRLSAREAEHDFVVS
jgi:hypothetical protein